MSVSGVNIVYLMRIKGDSNAAWKLAYQTDRETSESREYDSTPTIDGSVKSGGTYEGSHSVGSLLAKGDEDIIKIKNLVRNGGELELWKIDRTDLDNGAGLPGEYSVNIVTEVSSSAGPEESVELSIELEVSEGTIIDGVVNVTPALKQMLQTLSDEIEFVQPDTAAE